MIPRPSYVDKLLAVRDPEIVKVITGVRRCGKSTLLALLRERLLRDGISSERIVTVDLELASNFALADPVEFVQHVISLLPKDESSFLFVDEVQELGPWARVINGLRAEYPLLDIYVTGSSSRMLAGEDASYLSGRYIEIKAYPLSFKEFFDFGGGSQVSTLEGALTEYERYGSFPAVVLAKEPAIKEAILAGLFDSVFTRDVVLRGRIRNQAAFARVSSFVLDNVGSETSAHSIANVLKSSGHGVGSDTVDAYLNLMCMAYLTYRCERYDIRGKERLRTNGKYYVVDTGLRNQMLGADRGNRGHVTENLVFLELLRRGYEVSVGVLPQAEIDFVAQSPAGRIYIQVSETILDPNVYAREMGAFSKLKDGYPRIIITKDREDLSHEGVRHLNLCDFLLGEELT